VGSRGGQHTQPHNSLERCKYCCWAT